MLLASGGSGTRKPENPTRLDKILDYPKLPEPEIWCSGTTRPDPKPEKLPAGTRKVLFMGNFVTYLGFFGVLHFKMHPDPDLVNSQCSEKSQFSG